jgi:hypothetical protein
MYPRSGRLSSREHRARYWGQAQGALDRLLLVVGAVALLALVPIVWIWVLYGAAFDGAAIYAFGIGLCLLTAGIGYAMIRILDGKP